MAEIKGTPQKDVVTVKSGDTYHGEEGDDEITLLEGSTGQGNAGNDKITVADNAKWATVWYWWSPGVIYVDLEAGYALDGYGSRDTLINVHNVHGFQRNGDKGYGTAIDDSFYLGSNWERRPGSVYIDGKGGIDQVGMGYNPDDNFGPVVVNVSADGRLVKIHNANYPSFVYELHNIERFNVWNNLTKSNQDYDLLALRDLSRAGEQILLRGAQGWQTQVNGSPTAITYSFMTQAPISGGEGGTGFVAFNAQQQQILRDVLYVLQQQTGLSFAEVAGEGGQLRFGINQQANTRGYSYLPDAFKGDARAGDVWLDVETGNVMKPGQEGYYVLLHELAHALGLQHPLSDTDVSGATVLAKDLAIPANTLMLDLSMSATGGAWPTWFGSFDLQALRALYGSRTYASGHDVYSVLDASGPLTIVDDGGVDTLDASAVSMSVSIDLHPGKSSSVGSGLDGMAKRNNVSIAGSSVIENAIGSAYDDVIIGNAANNTITFTGGNDIVDGEVGMDVLRVWSNATGFKVQKDSATKYWNLEALNNEGGSAELRNLERIMFADTAWALDSGENESAGRVAKILGAIFGKEGLANMAYRGIGMFYFDTGMSYEALTLLALDARVGPGASREVVAQLLQANVPGYAINPGAFSSTTAMAIDAQESALNEAMVDVVGLANAGLPYQFWG
jgi:serralysin